MLDFIKNRVNCIKGYNNNNNILFLITFLKISVITTPGCKLTVLISGYLIANYIVNKIFDNFESPY